MEKEKKELLKIAVAISIVTILGLGTWMAVMPFYNVWSSEMNGKAQLANAEFSKKVAVETAKADLDSATYYAEAEVERAKGVAEANEIIGDSLRDNEAYLRYLWIDNLKDNGANVIYVPTEAGLPILEAQRLGK